MTIIMVANPKGGSGKSTLAVHVAAWFAQQEAKICLGDWDPQQSSAEWLRTRPTELPGIQTWAVEPGQPELPPPPQGCSIAVLDTPAGLHGKALKQLLKQVDHVVIPVCPSAFDMRASASFFAVLAELKSVRQERVRLCSVAMRVQSRARSQQQLLDFLQDLDAPLLASIRETQRYVQVVQAGMSLFDLPHALTRPDREQWRPLLDHLVQARPVQAKPVQSKQAQTK